MPFSSQPRKKGTTGPQDGIKKPACGHSSSQKACPDCQKSTAKVIDLPTEKKKLAVVSEKITDKLFKDRKAIDKAAFVLSNWINKKTK